MFNFNRVDAFFRTRMSFIGLALIYVVLAAAFLSVISWVMLLLLGLKQK